MANYKLYTDGCYYIEDNIAGYGGYIEDPQGKVIAEFSEVIHDSEYFNRHESLGMKKGLELCLEHNIKNIECYTDEKGLARIYKMNNRNALLKYSTNPVLMQIHDLKEHFENISFTHIPREMNAKADKYSRKAVQIERKQSPLYLQRKAAKKAEKLEKQNLLHSLNLLEKLEQLEALKNVQKQLDYSNKYSKNVFNSLNKTFTDFIVIDSTPGKHFTVHYAKKDLINQTVESQILSKTEFFGQKKPVDILKQMINALNQVKHLHEVVICSYAGLSVDFEKIIKNQIGITEEVKPVYEQFVALLNDFEKVTYHIDAEVIDLTIKPVKKVTSKVRENILFEAMKQLGNMDYVLGSCPQIETILPIKEGLEVNETTIQQRYFGEFIKLQLNKIPRARANIPLKKEVIMETVKQVKENFAQQGVTLRM